MEELKASLAIVKDQHVACCVCIFVGFFDEGKDTQTSYLFESELLLTVVQNASRN